jgi:glycerophosphoryl diester phosphodiesterase
MIAMRAPETSVIAHRGASGHAPENTAPAFDLAIALGATAIEIDVQLTRDGQLVVWHDDTIERTAQGPPQLRDARIRDLTWSELRTCDVGSWFNDRYPLLAREEFGDLKPMILDEALARYGTQIRLYIEPKCVADSPETIRSLAHSLRATATPHRHAVLAHRPQSLQGLQDEYPDFEPVLLMDRLGTSDDLGIATAARLAAAISPHKDLIDARLVAHAHWNDVAVYPHTVNHPGEMRHLVELGVDALITDLPDHAVFVLGEATARVGAGSPARPA